MSSQNINDYSSVDTRRSFNERLDLIEALISESRSADAKDILSQLLEAPVDWQLERARVQMYQAYLAMDSGEFIEAEGLLEEAEICLLTEQDNQLLGLLNNYLGLLEHKQDRFTIAISCFLKSIEYNQEAGYNFGVIKTYNNIALAYHHAKDEAQALHYIELGIKMAKENKYQDLMAVFYGNLGAINAQMGDLDQAETNMLKTIELYRKQRDQVKLCSALNNLARLYIQSAKLDQAKRLLDESSAVMGSSAEFDWVRVRWESHYGELLQGLNQVEEALEHHQIAYSLSTEKDFSSPAAYAAKAISTCYKNLGKFEEALLFQERYCDHQFKHQQGLNALMEKKLNAANQRSFKVKEGDAYKQINENLRRSNKDLERFAYIASHDLKEPLRMINTYMGLIEKRYGDRLDESGREFLHFAMDGGKRMGQLLEGLLNYSRVTTRAEAFKQTDLNEIYQIVLKNLSLAIEDKKAKIICDPLPKIVCDEAQFIQVFQNLISNALKFTVQGVSPELNISCQEDGERWHMIFSDKGIGIDPSHHEKIFDILTRVHSRSEYEGSGIGLSVVRKIIERHGGMIYVESEVGEGSQFHVLIPK